MAFVVLDGVMETSTTTGTGTYTLAGAPTGYDAFSGVGANNYCPYTARMGSTREVGIGRYLTGPARLERTVVLSGAAVNWGAGTKEIRLTLPAALSHAQQAGVADGRLTLASGDPTPITDQTAKTTVYYEPFVGNRIAIYNGAAWVVYETGGINISVPAAANTVYDVFAYVSGGAPALELTAWTNDTTRATNLTFFNGVLTRTGASTRRYLGTFRTTGVSGQTEDSLAKRYLWNAQNRIPRAMAVTDNTANWAYSTTAWRQANGSTANQLDMVMGLNGDVVNATVDAQCVNSTATARKVVIGIGLDSTTAPATASGAMQSAGQVTNEQTVNMPSGRFLGYVGAGRHILTWLEFGAGTDTQTWEAGIKGGIRGVIMA